MNNNTHTARMAVLLALMVVALLTVAVSQFSGTDGQEQQAAVLRAYAK